MQQGKFSRRGFLQGALAAGVASALPWRLARASERSLGVALVGLGNYSSDRLAPGLQLTRHCHLAGVVSGSPDKIKHWQQQYQLPERNCYSYEDFHRIADNPEIDVVYVVLPNHLHARYSIAAAEAGKHVWCEKPMAMDAAEAEQMIAAARRNKVKLSIGYRLLHEPNTRRIMQLAQSRPFGQMQQLRVEAGFHAYQESDVGHNWRLDPACGGGAMYDMGVYSLNAARYTTGREPLAVTARSEVRRPQIFRGVDEFMHFDLEFDDGLVANCATSFGQNMNLLHADCQHGWYELSPFQPYDGIAGRASDGQVFNASVPHQQALQMDEDALAILRDLPLRAPGEQGLADMRVLDAIFASVRAGGARMQLPG